MSEIDNDPVLSVSKTWKPRAIAAGGITVPGGNVVATKSPNSS